MIACSEIGVSRTRRGPNSLEQPLGRLEHAAGGGRRPRPGSTRVGSRSISCAIPRATASRYVSSATWSLRRPRRSVMSWRGIGERRPPWPPRSRDRPPPARLASISSRVALSTPIGEQPLAVRRDRVARQPASTSASGRYLAGSAREWPPWRYVFASISDGPLARARPVDGAASRWRRPRRRRCRRR